MNRRQLFWLFLSLAGAGLLLAYLAAHTGLDLAGAMAGGEETISFISSTASVYVSRREKTMNFCHRRFDAGLSVLERAASSPGFPEMLCLVTRLKEPLPCPLLHP